VDLSGCSGLPLAVSVRCSSLVSVGVMIILVDFEVRQVGTPAELEPPPRRRLIVVRFDGLYTRVDPLGDHPRREAAVALAVTPGSERAAIATAAARRRLGLDGGGEQ
jgi:hypothetical protein